MSALAAGQSVGRYQVIAPLGAGGMGEVYRARDPVLGREVALKVLPETFASDPDRLRRFEREARLVAALSHPGIVAVLDVGEHGGAPFLVLELLEGTTLRERLVGPLPARRAAAWAAQAARALAAAHDRGVLHRDLKPENLFVTGEGRIKLLDFGLARLTVASEPATSAGETVTSAGVVLGTLPYMSPEQARGEAVDHRSDVFALGAVLWEMLAGRRAFPGATRADTLAAILREDPGDPAPGLPPGLLRILRRCLEKEPAQRFQSASDAAFALEELAGLESGLPLAQPARSWRGQILLLLTAVGLCALALPRLAPRVAEPPAFRRLTFRSGRVTAARFTPGGVAYSALWDGEPEQVFLGSESALEARPLGPGHLAGRGLHDELLLLLRPHGAFVTSGTLASQAETGLAPRELLEHVQQAAVDAGGRLAVVHREGQVMRLESPPGTVLFEARPPGWIGPIAISPDGETIAFLDHPAQRYDEQGAVAIVDRRGQVRRLTPPWFTVSGLAFAPGGREVLFSGGPDQGASGVFAVGLDGRLRTVLRGPDPLVLHDVSGDGKLLVLREQWRIGVQAHVRGAARERDLSWFDGSWARDLSADGEKLLFDEEGDAGGARAGVFLRSLDGSPAVRLGDGHALALSPDGRWALARLRFTTPPELVLWPTGAGQRRSLPTPGLETHESASILPDGRVLVLAHQSGREARCYLVDPGGAAPRAVTPEGVGCRMATPDGAWVLGYRETWQLWPLAGGEPRPAPGLREDDRPARFSADGTALYVSHGELPGEVERVDLRSGQRTPVAVMAPPEVPGFVAATPPLLSADGQVRAYSVYRNLSDLFLVTP